QHGVQVGQVLVPTEVDVRRIFVKLITCIRHAVQDNTRRGPRAMAEPVSPPTDRVVAVLELLAGNESRTVSEVARALDLNRSTATAVLTALAGAGWVERLPDRGYVLGPGLLPVAEAAFARLPV